MIENIQNSAPSVMHGQIKPVVFPELLAPAGNYEKLVTAVHYGADAVYLGLDWDTAGSGAVRAIWQGAQSGSTQTIAGVFAGNFAATLALYFAASSTPTSVLDGGLAHVGWFDDIPSAAEDLNFATLLGCV